MGGLGYRKEIFKMHDFKWISKRNPEVRAAYQEVVSILKEVQKEVKKQFTFQFMVVGSYKRNLITYDAKSSVGFDFDFNIMVNDEEQDYEAKEIRKILRLAIDMKAKKYGYDNAEDSTRVLTIKKKDIPKSKILHSCDFCIVNDYIDEEGYDCQEYIHFIKNEHRYEWREQGNGFYELDDKIDWIKKNDHWDELKEEYIFLKNNNNNPDNHSRQLFAQAVSNVCNWYCE